MFPDTENAQLWCPHSRPRVFSACCHKCLLRACTWCNSHVCRVRCKVLPVAQWPTPLAVNPQCMRTLGCSSVTITRLLFRSHFTETSQLEVNTNKWFISFSCVLSTVSASPPEFLLPLHRPSLPLSLFVFSHLFVQSLHHSLLRILPSCHPPPPPFSPIQAFECSVVFFGVMITCYVVSQLLVIRSNIISKAINGRQYSCILFFPYFFFFHFSQNILTSLLFILTGSGLITFRETSRLGMEENKLQRLFLIKTKVSVLVSIFLLLNMWPFCYISPC